MCGIGGYHSFDGNYDPRYFVALTNIALHMQNRGTKSWGYTNGVDILKSLGKIEDGWNYTFAQFGTGAIHTRHPTQGDLIAENSHPFRIGDVIGMHNGMVYNHHELQSTYGRSCKVDSEHIFHHINDGHSLTDVRAYGAVVYWKDGVLHLGRFNGGELTLARTQSAWLFASTENAVRQSARFAGLNGKNFVVCNLELGKIYRLINDKIEVAGSFNFGSYYKGMGSWDDHMGNDYTQYTAGTRSSRPSNFPRSSNHTIPATPVTTPSTPNISAPVSLDNKVERMLRVCVFKRKAVDDLIEAQKSKKAEEEADLLSHDWSCGLCHNTIPNGDLFDFTVDNDIICESCAKDHPTLVASTNPLRVLPSDIVMLDSILDTKNASENEVEVRCESCNSVMQKNDLVVLLQDGSMVCTGCFAEGEGEDIEIDDGEYVELPDIELTDSYTDEEKRIALFADGSVSVYNLNTKEIAIHKKDSEGANKLIQDYFPEFAQPILR